MKRKELNMKLSDVAIGIEFTEDDRPVVTIIVRFDNPDQMTEYIQKLRETFEQSLDVDKQAKEIIDNIVNKRASA